MSKCRIVHRQPAGTVADRRCLTIIGKPMKIIQTRSPYAAAHRGLAVLLAAGALATHAQRPPDVSPGEMALIPEYCPHTMGFQYGDQYTNTSPQAAGWVAKMGKGFWHMHHYCWGLIKERRALQPGQRKEIREGLLKNVVTEYQYVIRNVSPDFILLPEVLVKLGDAHRRVGDLNNAKAAYDSALERRPDYWPACTRWADALAESNQKAAALSHLLGCMKASRAPELREYFLKLDGPRSALPAEPVAASAASSAR